MESRRVIVMGPTGCGKTTLVKKWVEELKGRVIFVADPNQYYSCRQRFYTAEEMAAWVETSWEKIKPGVYCATFSDPRDWEAFFIIVAAVSGASDVPPREIYPCVLVVDELAKFSDSKSTTDALQHLIEYGRHCNLWLYYCSMQGRNISRLLLTNASTIVCFCLPEEDLAHLKGCVSIVGADFDRCRELKIFKWPEDLKDGLHYIAFGEGGTTTKEVIRKDEKIVAGVVTRDNSGGDNVDKAARSGGDRADTRSD